MDELLNACRRANEILFHIEASKPFRRILRENPRLQDQSRVIQKNLDRVVQVNRPAREGFAPEEGKPLKAVAWNIERGKNWKAVRHALLNHPEIKDADFYFLTEVDWGMARSGNENITARLAEAKDFWGYFAASYFNLSKGHGVERDLPGDNELGLHGKAILSRYPLQGLRAVPLPNATDKLASKEARLGEKRALLGEFQGNGRRLTLACAHLDAFSSPKSRARQLEPAVAACASHQHVLLAGDWNTNTLNSTNGPSLVLSLLGHVLKPGPQQMFRRHFPRPEQLFEQPLFQSLRSSGFDFEGCNEMGTGTFELLANDRELGKMASDQYPTWILRWINRQVEKSGGRISLKLDWFAAKNLNPIRQRVIPLKPEDSGGLGRPSDHHPIFLEFMLGHL